MPPTALLDLLQSNKLGLAAAFIGLWTLLYIARLNRDPLRDIPGPFLARFTRLWELWKVREGSFQELQCELHSTYGSVVRVAPDRYSINDVEAFHQIYHHGSKFVKSAFYHPFGNPNTELADLFSERSIERHAQKRRKVASLYSMSTLLSYERYVDNCNETLVTKMRSFATAGVVVDVPTWLQYYAFDVIGEISIGQPFGLMASGTDQTGILAAIHDSMVYGSRIGLLPELHPVLARVARSMKLPVPFDVVANFINANIEARKGGDQQSGRNDFLSKLLHLLGSQKIQDLDVFTTLGANIAAGSDTTAVSLSTIIYHLARKPERFQKLRQELQHAVKAGLVSTPITYQESQKLSYLQAVIKEALRVHPAVGQMLARVVPQGGAVLCGRGFPAGVEVGINPWVIHSDQEIFGPRPHEFIPERWLGDEKKVSRMNTCLFSFGAGARTCVGKNISMLEMSKVIPELYRRFDFILEPPDREWKLDNVWFVKQSFKCRVAAVSDHLTSV